MTTYDKLGGFLAEFPGTSFFNLLNFFFSENLNLQ